MAPPRRTTRITDIEKEGRSHEVDAEEELGHAIGVGHGLPSQIPADRIWTMYNEKAETYDEMLVARLKGSMDSIIIFAGLFSAVVTAFIIESYKTLSADSGDITVFYLAQISQQLAGTGNVTLPLSAPPFKAPRTSVAVNILWILSLIFSLACALGSTLIQNWTNRYMRKANRSPDLVQRARDRARFYDGIRKSQMRNLADGVPGLLHIALFLFLAGLVVFLFPINHDVAWAAMAASTAFTVIYLLLAALHLSVPSWPYHTPLSYALAGAVITPIAPVVMAINLSLAAVFNSILIITLILLLIAYAIYKLLGYFFGFSIDFNAFFLRFRPDRSPREGLFPWETIKRVEPDVREIKQDRRILDFLLQKSNSISEVEQFLEGVESFIDRDSHDDLGVTFVLRLGDKFVESLFTEFGPLVGILLHSCSSSFSADMLLEQRRTRSMACVRAMIALFTHSTTEQRIADTFPPIVNIFWWLPRAEVTSNSIIPIRWRDWVTRVTLHGLINLRSDEDSILAFAATCLSSLLIQRSLVDLAYRIDQKEVIFDVPRSWTVGDLLQASKGIHKQQLFELYVAVTLVSGVSNTSGDTSTSDEPIVYGVPPGQWGWKARPISVAFPTGAHRRSLDSHAEEEASLRSVHDVSELQESRIPLKSKHLRNEATLFAVHRLIEHVSKSEVVLTRSHADLLLRTMRGLVTEASASETSVRMQSNFLDLLLGIYGSGDSEIVKDPVDPRYESESSSMSHSRANSPKPSVRGDLEAMPESQFTAEPVSPLRPPASHSPPDPNDMPKMRGRPEPAGRSLLLAREIMDLILSFIETLDSTECSDSLAGVKTLLRPQRQPSSSVSLPASVRPDEDKTTEGSHIGVEAVEVLDS